MADEEVVSEGKGEVVENKAVATPAKDAPAKTTETIASGAGDDAPVKEGPSTWPDDWRAKLAGEDTKQLKQLEQYTDPTALWKKTKSLEKKLNEKASAAYSPPKDATPEEVSAWRKERGIPDKPESYLEAIKLPKGEVLGDLDKPIVEGFAAAMHNHNATPGQVAAAYDWYRSFQQAQSDLEAETDAQFKQQARDTLRDEWGADFKANLNASASLFRDMPGDVRDRLLAGRTSDGRLVGDDPAIVKWMASLALEVNPAYKVVPSTASDTGKTMEDEINHLRQLMAKDTSEYWVGPNAKKNQARFAELIDAREKRKSRAA